METETQSGQALAEMYNYAASLMADKTDGEVTSALVERGLSQDAAYTIVTNLRTEIRNLKKNQAKKDMLYGALWCIGGTVATLAKVGFIFWGAILFGGIQFIKGLVNTLNSD